MSFQGCWERIKRAEAHRHTLTEAWNTFIDGDAYSARSYIQDDGTGGILVTPRDSVPIEIALLLGEMLYQLRAALDGAVYAAAIQDSGSPIPPDHESLEFPIRKDAPVRADQIKGFMKQIAPLSTKRKRIIEVVQPYNRPTLELDSLVFNHNRNLWLITDLARKDRHRQLHIVGSWASNILPQLRIPVGTEVEYLRPSGPLILKNEQEIARFKISGWRRGMEVQTNPNLTIDISVDEFPVAAADNDTFDARLKGMIKATEHVVFAIENPTKIWISDTFKFL